MGRSFRPWWVAIAVSLLLHASLLGGLDWVLPQWEAATEPPTLNVELAAAPPRAVPQPPPPRRQPAAHKPVHKPVHKPAVRRPPPPPVPSPPPVPAAVAPSDAGSAVASAPNIPPSSPPPAVEPAPPLNTLPQRIDLRFELRYGLARGEQTLVWVNDGEHYTVTSVAAATGLTGLFYRGRFVQTSRGRITPQGLQPQEFWDQRGDKRSSARFDALQGEVTLTPAQGEARHFPYQGAVQDALSLFFQLALTAPPEGEQRYLVFNGKKLRDYTYEVGGEETLDTALGPLRTLHLIRAGSDGRFEAWLAIDRHYLPVRVLRTEGSGAEAELAIASISETE